MTARAMHYTTSHTNVCKFLSFQLKFSQLILLPEMLKLDRVTKVTIGVLSSARMCFWF